MHQQSTLLTLITLNSPIKVFISITSSIESEIIKFRGRVWLIHILRSFNLTEFG